MRPIENRDQHRPKVGIAMEELLRAGAVARTLSQSGKFEPSPFTEHEVAHGAWPPGPFAAIVASPKAHARRLRGQLAGADATPIILALDRASYGSSRAQILRADSFVLTDTMLPLLPSLVTLSQHGLGVVPPHARNAGLTPDPRLGQLEHLSNRDRAVLGELSAGRGNEAIASRLGITAAGAKMHIRRIVDSLGFKNRTDAAVFAATLMPNGDRN